MMTKRCALYARVSTSRQEEEGTSLQTQTALCRDHATAHGYEIDESLVYREVYSGAELWDRPHLTSIRQLIRERKLDVVVCYAIDRLSRDPVHLGVILTEADRYGVEIEFVSEPLDDSPEGQLIRFVRGYAARVEREKARERTIRGKRARLESGKIHGFGGELYGYHRDKAAGVRVIVEPEALVVRRIFTRIAAGNAIRAVARDLNAEDVQSPAAGKRELSVEGGKTPRWNKSSIWRIVTNPAYRGETAVWKQARQAGAKTYIDRPESEWIRLPEGTTPPIVTPELWTAAQSRLATNRGAATRNQITPYLLRGYVYCAVCGRRMYSCPERGRRTYRCSSRDTASGPCGGKRVPAEAVETWAWSHVEAVLSDPSIIANEVERQRLDGPDAGLVADRAATARLLEKLDRQQEKLVRKFAEADDADPFPWELIEREIARIEGERQGARVALEALDTRLAAQAAAVVHLASLQSYCSRVTANLAELDFDRRRQAIEALLERVVVNSGDAAQWRIEGAIPESAGATFHSSANCGRRRPPLRGRA